MAVSMLVRLSNNNHSDHSTPRGPDILENAS